MTRCIIYDVVFISWPLWLFIFFHNEKEYKIQSQSIFWGIEVVRYWEVKLHWIEQFGLKKLSGIRNREDSVFRVFYHIKNRREKFGTDEIVRFHGDSGIERIRFRGFLLYTQTMPGITWYIVLVLRRQKNGGTYMFDGIFLRGLGGSNVSNSSCILCSSHLVRTSTLKFCVPSAMSAAYVSRFEFPPIIFYTMAHVVCYNCYFHPVTKKIKTPVTTYELGNRWCPFDYHKIVFPLNIMF